VNAGGPHLPPHALPIAACVRREVQAQEFVLDRLEAMHTYILARAQEGCGASLPVLVRAGGQASYASPTAVNTLLSFPSPTVTLLSVPAGSGYTTATLATGGGQTVVIAGANFGPLRNPPTGGALITPLVQYAGGPGGALSYAAATCTKAAATAHTQITCTTAPGAGRDFRWTVEVCGQRSAPSTATTSFAPPIITSIGGTGRSGASTEGGQALTISGSNLGYAAASDAEMAIVVESVRYGRPAVLQFTAVSCRASSPSRIDCLTAEGTGRNHSLQAVIAGQASNAFVGAMSYAEPVLSNFDRAVLSPTRGGEEVHIIGSNFGFDIALVTAQYTDQLLVPRASDGVMPGSPPGIVRFTPTSCAFVTPHRVISCRYTEGAGSGTSWSMGSSPPPPPPATCPPPSRA